MKRLSVSEFQSKLIEHPPHKVTFSSENQESDAWKIFPDIVSEYSAIKAFLLPGAVILTAPNGRLILDNVTKIDIIEENDNPRGFTFRIYFNPTYGQDDEASAVFIADF